jgi:osmotically-inducible protein OsmY
MARHAGAFAAVLALQLGAVAARAEDNNKGRAAQGAESLTVRNLRALIRADKSLSKQAARIGIAESAGKLVLTGSVPTEAEKDNIGFKAAGFVGIQNVQNDLVVEASR